MVQRMMRNREELRDNDNDDERRFRNGLNLEPKFGVNWSYKLRRALTTGILGLLTCSRSIALLTVLPCEVRLPLLAPILDLIEHFLRSGMEKSSSP
jgi:hypothetical protein